MIMVHVAQALGRFGAAADASCGGVACAGDLQGKDDAACGQVMLVLDQAVVFDLFFVGEVVVLTMQVTPSLRRRTCWRGRWRRALCVGRCAGGKAIN
jgi:hypothetical protein